MKKVVLIICVVFLILLFGCVEQPVEQKETIKVGVMLPLTGDAAVYGESFSTALKLATEEINVSGGIDGKQIELVIEDSKCDAIEGVKAINSLVNLHGLKLIIAAECSGPSLSAAPIAEKAKVLYLVAIASTPEIKNSGEYVFRIAPADDQQGEDLAKLIFNKNYRNTAVLYVNNASGAGIAQLFIEDFNKRGGNVIEQKFNQGDSDFRTQLLKIKERDADSILVIAYSEHYPIIIKQMYELGIELPMFSSDTFKDETIIKSVGDLANGVIFTNFYESNSEKFVKFKNAYYEKYGKNYGPYGDYAYDVMYVLKEGIEQAGSFDPEILKESLYELEYEGVTGLTKFDELGEVFKPFGILIVEDGEFVNYK
jgi:branched-chain amino acid transport system substrate-binding protein